MKRIIILLSLLTALSMSYSQDPLRKSRLLFVPIGGYANDTNVVLGGLAYYTYRPANRSFNLMPDTHYLQPMISFNNQWQLNYRSEFYYGNDRYLINPEAEYEVWPTEFYGIGNNTLETDRERYTNNRYAIRLGVTRYFEQPFSFGINLANEGYNLTDLESGGKLEGGTIAGSDRFMLNRIGAALSYDTRDVALYPTRGCYHQFAINHSLKAFGGDYSYTKYSLDLRRYFSLNSNTVAAWQGYLSHIDNTAPIQKLNDLGNEIRGYEAKRFIDNSFFMTRGEIRVFPWSSPLLSRLGGVFFLETGQVASKLDAFSMDEIKISYGTGLRIAMIPDENINLRVDVGFSDNVVDVVITTYEIF